jgi:hypothetical protein
VRDPARLFMLWVIFKAGVVWQEVSPVEQQYMNEVLHTVSFFLIISQCHLIWSSQHWFCQLRMSLQLVVSCLLLTDQFDVTVL